MGKHIWMMLFDCIILIPNQERTKLKLILHVSPYSTEYIMYTEQTQRIYM